MKYIKFNYIDILNEQLEIRSARNINYSLRAFARDLELSPSRLSQILSKKKGLSVAGAFELAEKLGLNERERDYFILSVKAQHARSSKAKAEAKESLSEKLTPESSLKQLELREFEQAHNWYHMALLELVELNDCEHSVEWFAKKLKLKKVIIKNAIERLVKIGWLDFENGVYRASFEESETTNDIPSVAIKKFHEEVLKKAEESLFVDDVKDREFTNMTFAFSKDQMQSAKETIRIFQKEFAKKHYPKFQNKDSVYQLSVQLFRLDSNLEKQGEL
jgi:uncharacterized protein (TIGR02147 family)